MAALPFTALDLLDQVQTLRDLRAFSAPRVLSRLGEEALGGTETLEDLEARLDGLRGVLAAADRFAEKAMGIRLTHDLAREPVPPHFRKLFAATVTRYDADRALLRERVVAAAAGLYRDPAGAEGLAGLVLAAAEQVLALRAELHAGVLDLTLRVAQQRLPGVQRQGRDRSQGEAERRRWLLARADLEGLLARPARLLEGSFAERLRTTEPPPEEPEAELPDARFSLLEID